MRIAIISDMHGNCVALDAVLADLNQHPVDQIVCLGDAIQGGPQPAEVVARLRELACPVIMGNADDWLLAGDESGAEQIPPERLRRMNEIREWSLSQLSPDNLHFIAQFQPTVEIPLTSDRNLLCFHGSPSSYDDIIIPQTSEEAFRALLVAFVPHVMCGGHTHLQQLRRLEDTFFFNPGSVGFAYSHQQSGEVFRADPWAEYAVLTADGVRIALEFRRVPFNVEELVAVYKASGRPYSEDAIAQYQL